MRLKLFIFLSNLVLCLSVMPARADLAFVLTPATQSGIGSNEVAFTGVLTNTSATDNLFLNNIQVSFNDAATNYLIADTNVFFANVPGILLPDETYSDTVFVVAINSAIPPSSYSGTVTIQGGPDIFAATDLASQTFQVSLPASGLSIALSNPDFILSWLSPPGNFVLQQNSDLTTTNWVTITNAPIVANGQNQVILLLSTSNRFYRLDYP